MNDLVSGWVKSYICDARSNAGLWRQRLVALGNGSTYGVTTAIWIPRAARRVINRVSE